jgi:predicted metal-dependent enzyme (double-stranded beta helix superfamily)
MIRAPAFAARGLLATIQTIKSNALKPAPSTGGILMTRTIEQFAAACHDILKAEPNPAGRSKVCTLLQDVLKDEQFVANYLKDDTPERKILYEDPELGFCILAHHYRGAKTSPPHDHGPYWAIYGQARGETEMSDYELLEPASPEKPGKVRMTRTYKLTPGVAHVYNEGDLHSPKRVDSTRLIRIEGVNMEKVKRFKFEVV